MQDKNKIQAARMLFILLAVFVVAFSCCSYQTIGKLASTSRTIAFIGEKADQYVALPFHNTANWSGTREEYDALYAKALGFYKQTVDAFDGILIESMNYEAIGNEKTLDEEYGQNWIVINEHFLEFNPIYADQNTMVRADTLDQRPETLNLLIPLSMRSETQAIKQKIQSIYSETGLTEEQIVSLIYTEFMQSCCLELIPAGLAALGVTAAAGLAVGLAFRIRSKCLNENLR